MYDAHGVDVSVGDRVSAETPGGRITPAIVGSVGTVVAAHLKLVLVRFDGWRYRTDRGFVGGHPVDPLQLRRLGRASRSLVWAQRIPGNPLRGLYAFGVEHFYVLGRRSVWVLRVHPVEVPEGGGPTIRPEVLAWFRNRSLMLAKAVGQAYEDAYLHDEYRMGRAVGRVASSERALNADEVV